MIVKKATSNDLTQILALYSEFTDAIDSAQAEKKFREIEKDSRYCLAVACEENMVMGTAMGVICHDLCGPGPFMVIENVVVSQDYRNQNVGNKIFDYLHSWAKEAGCYYAILVSSAYRRGAHSFYKKLGYTEEKGFRIYFTENKV